MSTDVRSTRLSGLSSAEAALRLREEGPNELPRRQSRGALRIVIDLFREPMLLLLLGAGALYLILGDRGEAILLLASIIFIVGIDLYQERRTEHALEALRDLASPRALVIRDGEPCRIPGREVVRGDLLVVSEGDRVAADGLLVSCANLNTDESLLTGESVPVRKVAATDDTTEVARPGGDDLPFVYSATVATAGQGVARVTAIGAATEMGRIGSALQTLRPERTRLQRETSRVVRMLAIAAAVLCVVVAVGTTLTRGSIVEGLLAAITVAMSLIPEEFPVVLTVFLALGAWRIARSRVLTRRIPAIEALGAVTVLCVDKTGTLTENRMTVARLATTEAVAAVDATPLDAPLGHLVRLAMLASAVEPFDPMERAFHELHRREFPDLTIEESDLLRAYPLSQDLLAMANAWRDEDYGEVLLAAKGAPEATISLCGLDPAAAEATMARVGEMAAEGLRVLGVASARCRGDALPDTMRDCRWTFAGLVGLADPVRAAVPAAVAEAQRAGIRVVMLTGDYPITAQSIAQQAGIVPADTVLTGADLEAFDDLTLREHVRHTSVFARVRPEQKLRLVRALQADGEVVAMTGDGVNDAPALQAADIGIAMGMRGTDVAREEAGIVLADDDFTSIVRAVRLGRRIFDNLRRAMAFLLAVHVPIAGLAVLPLIFGWPLILYPAHVVFLELVIDPACSVAFESEPEEADVMTRPPRSPGAPLFTRAMVALSAAQGLGVLAAAAGILVYALQTGAPETDARTITFVTIVVGNIGLILANRAGGGSALASIFTPNIALWLVVGGALALLAVVLTLPLARDLFQFASLPAHEVALGAGASVVALVWLDAMRLIGRRWERHSRQA